MKPNIIAQFNDITFEFIKQTEQITGKYYSMNFKLLTTFNNLIPIEMYIKNILPYKEYIYKKDEKFFIKMNINNTGYFEDIIAIKNIYENLDKKTKNNIWEYIQALTILADECNNICKK